jgi:Ca-activated chloride channel family protein
VILLLTALTCGVLALARPQWGAGVETVTRTGADVVLVIDTSRSMAAADVAPDRIGLARQAAASLLDRLAGDRVALVTFAGSAVLACPLTVDQGAVRLFLDAVDVETVAVPGTALADGIRAAIRAFGPGDGKTTRGRTIILFSDGEDHEGGVDEALEALRRSGVALFAVGCGTERGSPIPERDGPERFKKDREGRIVTTRLDEGLLTRLAVDSGGRSLRATPAGLEIDEIARAIAGLAGDAASTTLRTRYEERFQFPLALAIVALVAEAFVSETRRGTKRTA